MRFKIFAILVSTALSVSPVFARTDARQWCGTKGKMTTEFFIKNHEFRQKEFGIPKLSAASLKKYHQDVGEIAVIKSSPSTLIPINLFDLKGKKITYTKNPQAGFDVKVGPGSVSGNQGNALTLGDDDFEQVSFRNGFNFPYYGTTYNSVFVNSDGNLTFKQGDNAATERDVFRIITGPPRIALFFQDMDPSNAGQVRVLQSSTKFTVTWNGVSQFLPIGSNSNTFQVNLFKNGNIEFIFGTEMDTRSAIVGISEGNTTISNVRLVNYSNAGNNLKGVTSTILERFAQKQEIDFSALMNEFHKTHPQIFDFVVIWTDFPTLIETEGFAFYSGIQNNIKGIGDDQYNFTKAFGSPKLQGFLMMDYIKKYPQDPNVEVPTAAGHNSTIEVLAQENGHRWLAFPKVSIPGQTETLLLGRALSHWNFYMDTDASCMEGNEIRENGDGTFTTLEPTEIYSKLDRYMMGFLPASAVPGTFVVTGNSNTDSPPEGGVTIRGTKVPVSIQDIIRKEGARVPNNTASQKTFREAFIFYTRRGATSADIAHIDKIRTMWGAFWKNQHENKSTIDTTLP